MRVLNQMRWMGGEVTTQAAAPTTIDREIASISAFLQSPPAACRVYAIALQQASVPRLILGMDARAGGSPADNPVIEDVFGLLPVNRAGSGDNQDRGKLVWLGRYTWTASGTLAILDPAARGGATARRCTAVALASQDGIVAMTGRAASGFGDAGGEAGVVLYDAGPFRAIVRVPVITDTSRIAGCSPTIQDFS
jgi:hypothetical protein